MDKAAATKSAVSPQEALIYVMVTLSAVDREMTDREMRKIGDIVNTLPIFGGFDTDRLVQVAEDCAAITREADGLHEVLAVIATALPKKLHETAYALAVEVAAADLHVEQEELRFLELLRDVLDVDTLTAAAIERGARARYRTL
ncbi:tellurite resistance TerB family protein [Kaistia geumhonensis]|uniref:Tellurite resistance protein n=1 Tax=Kaistia geumhonensis TaxID=410839 RepID=A0ABU0M611_9HYPH|nr:tellurite resistance TerB family protein [Kaistia geumhonensis]MCX5478419.1 tellurite resistance TerB family protein [Kaistia geumhonensis]MDQ0516363.1 tellurite resistance protein [Kaistia geumhonensis]